MHPLFIFGFVVLCLLILFYIISKKEKFANVFSDAYDTMVHSITRSDKPKDDPQRVYNSMVGYEKSPIIGKTFARLKKKEKLYADNERKRKTSQRAYNEATTNSFIIGDIYRFSELENTADRSERNHAREMAGTYYNRTLERIRNNAVDVIIGNELDHGPTVDMMIDRANEFFQENNDLPVGVEIDFENLRGAVRDARVVAYMGGGVNNATPVKKRKPKRIGQTDKQYKQEQFYEPKNIRSDAQNVHEPQVSHDISRIYSAIKVENDKEDMITGGAENHQNIDIAAIRKEILTHPFTSEPARQRAISVLETMGKGGEVTALHDNEKNILINVWKRVHSSDNDDRRQFLKDAFMDSLSNGMEKNYYGDYAMVCANGRCDRVINSLTLIDSNPEISKPVKTKEIMRNEVLAKSYTILQEELKRADTAVVRAYNGSTPESEITTEVQGQVDDFITRVKGKIETQVRDDYKESDVRDPGIIDNLIKDAQSGV
jgi:hypothetical protein